MFIEATSPEASKYLVFLDGKPLKSYVAANEEEGWVDVISPAPIDLTDSSSIKGEPTPWEEIPVKRLQGQVKVVEVSSCQPSQG